MNFETGSGCATGISAGEGLNFCRGGMSSRACRVDGQGRNDGMFMGDDTADDRAMAGRIVR